MPELNEINESLADFEEELSKLKSASGLIEDAKSSAQITITESKIIMEKLIKESKKATDGAIEESKKLNESATNLNNAVDVLMEKLDKVDFPARLDKLDSTVSGINTAIQNIFGRFETVERNLKDDFHSQLSYLKEKIEKSQKLNSILWFLILLLTGSSLILLLVKFDVF